MDPGSPDLQVRQRHRHQLLQGPGRRGGALGRRPLLGAATLLAGAWTGLGAWPALLYGFIISTVLLWHATFTINSLAHLWGTRRFATADGSRNNVVLALLTFGEGWHNNHHHYQAACRQGIRWWELDLTYLCLKLLSWTGLVWDLKPYRQDALAGEAP